MAASSIVSSVPQHQVFLNFRGELRNNFISHLAKALRDKQVNCFIDEDTEKGKHLDSLFMEIKNSRIALAIFSQGYTGSTWCLNELVTIKQRMDEGKLETIPIFYKVTPTDVKNPEKAAFGNLFKTKVDVSEESWRIYLRGYWFPPIKKIAASASGDEMRKWKEALWHVARHKGFEYYGNIDERTFIENIVEAVLEKLNKNFKDENTNRSVDQSRNTQVSLGEVEAKGHELCGLKQRLEELEEKLASENNRETRIVGVVGMHGIGKTTLLKAFYEKSKNRFSNHSSIQVKSGTIDERGFSHLPGNLKEFIEDPELDEETSQEYKKTLLKKKVLIVLDGVNNKRQIHVLKGFREWTKEGSKILIATCDKSLLHGLVDDAHIYVVPQLTHRDGLEHFHRYAFRPPADKEDFMKLSKEYVHYARGHPLALELLGDELRGKPMALWEEKLHQLAQNPSPSIREYVLQRTYDELINQAEKDAFLDIACFRYHDLVYVKSLLDSSSGPDIAETPNTIDALKDKFLINISDNRVEMHDFLYTFAMELGPKACAKDGRGRHRIWYQRNKDNGDMLNRLQEIPGGRAKVRSFFLDLYDIKDVTLGTEHLKQMRVLRYLKFYSSHCPQECDPKEIIHIPDELELPLEEIRCLHWLNFPLDELPRDFIPKNLVDLKLPYSKIKQIWKQEKDAPKLKWVDLNHSSKLETLSGLSKAPNLQKLNLEGCTALKTLDLGEENMKSLVFLNLKGCTALESLPKIKLISLKTLILSNCSNLEKFWVISETLYALYLDGSAISKLPTDMVKLTKLVKLVMKDCKLLKRLPEGFGELTTLQELVLSGCSTLKSLPDKMENLKCLQILMLDGTTIEKIPHIPSLERLCLSGNNNIIFLDDMSQLSELKWLDLKYCKKLLSIPKLPPNLKCLDADGCASLKTIANPLATNMPTEQIHSTFTFTNCNKLERTAKEEITTYAQRKCQFLSDTLKRSNESFVPEALFSTCFPGCEVPSWFFHESVGSTLKLDLLPHWNENKVFGIALCAVVSFSNCQQLVEPFSVTCKFNLKIKGKDGGISFDRLVGHWSNKLDMMPSDHVFICYTRCSNNIKSLEDLQSGTCTPTVASFEFGVTDEKAKVEVLNCGIRLVYASDESKKKKSDETTIRDNNDAESYKTSTKNEEIELQGSTTKRNDSCSSMGSGSLSTSGEYCSVFDEASSYTETPTGR